MNLCTYLNHKDVNFRNIIWYNVSCTMRKYIFGLLLRDNLDVSADEYSFYI